MVLGFNESIVEVESERVSYTYQRAGEELNDSMILIRSSHFTFDAILD